jgi:hypothetical protein
MLLSFQMPPSYDRTPPPSPHFFSFE